MINNVPHIWFASRVLDDAFCEKLSNFKNKYASQRALTEGAANLQLKVHDRAVQKIKTAEEFVEWQQQSDGEMEELESQLAENFYIPKEDRIETEPHANYENFQTNYRRCERHTIDPDLEPWFVNILMHYARIANKKWLADINYIGQSEVLVYEEPDDHYEWHIDGDIIHPTERGNQRKLTCIIQLSDHNEYEGCDIEMTTSLSEKNVLEEHQLLLRQKGTVLIFPSYINHRVTPLISGRRESIVSWVEGPQWR